MKTELLNIFDAKGQHAGVSSRKEVHKEGYWHETFHCWIISEEEGRHYIHFQVRSEKKTDYPGLLDISAAGHLLAGEDVTDGIREVHEELGMNVSMEELISLGTIPDEIIQKDMIDKELGHVYLYFIPPQSEVKYTFHDGEITGVFKIELNAFTELWKEEVHTISVKEIIDSEHNRMKDSNAVVQKKDFLPHSDLYITKVLEAVNQKL